MREMIATRPEIGKGSGAILVPLSDRNSKVNGFRYKVRGYSPYMQPNISCTGNAGLMTRCAIHDLWKIANVAVPGKWMISLDQALEEALVRMEELDTRIESYFSDVTVVTCVRIATHSAGLLSSSEYHSMI